MSTAAPPVSALPQTAPAAVPSSSQPLPPGASVRRLPYHRLALADQRHRWWSPLAEGGIAGAGIVIVTILFFLVWFGVFLLGPGADALSDPQFLADPNALDIADPWILVMLFGSIAIWLPVVLGARLLMRPRPLGLIWSVAGRLRWRWLGLALLVAAGLYLVLQIGLGAVLEQLQPPQERTPFEPQPWWWLSLALALLIVPLQCTAEELVFRGFLAQSLGRWLRHPLWAILLPVPLFMLGHAYDLWGQLSVGFMALAAGVITWRTGGLEAAMALHIVNNLSATIPLLFAPADPGAMSESVGWGGFALIAALETLYTAIVWILAGRRGVAVARQAVVWPRRQRRLHEQEMLRRRAWEQWAWDQWMASRWQEWQAERTRLLVQAGQLPPQQPGPRTPPAGPPAGTADPQAGPSTRPLPVQAPPRRSPWQDGA